MNSTVQDLAEITKLFGVLADQTRLRIVRLMAANREQLCVCELVDCLEEPQYHISRHLRDLRGCGLLTAERDGKWVYYGLAQGELIEKIAQVVADLPAEPFARAQANFEARISLRTDGRCRIGIQHQVLKNSPVNQTKHHETNHFSHR